MKNSNNINSLQVEDARLSKSKSYLKIIGIPLYPHLDSQEKLTLADIETILQQNHIFDNVSLTSKPRIIKVSPKSDMAIVWIDICYDSMLKVLSKELTLVLSDTRELDRVSSTK